MHKKMTEQQFLESNTHLPAKFLAEIVQQCKQYEKFEECLSFLDMTGDNVETYNPEKHGTEQEFLMNSMASMADMLYVIGYR